MPIVAALFGAFLGYQIGEASTQFLGVVLGGLIGWLVVFAIQARRKIADLEDAARELYLRVADAQSQIESRTEHRPETARPEPTPEVRRPVAPAVAPARPIVPPAQPPVFEPRPLDRPPPPAERPMTRPVPSQASAEPSEPILVRVIREWFTGGNTVVRVGVVILFIGLAFLVRYVAQRVTVPIEFRLSGVALTALVLLVIGWRLRLKRAGYALALQGGAIAILYLTVFAAFRLYTLLPAAPTFLLLVAVAVLSAILAILQNSLAVALLGIAGGFLAPILASTGQGNHVFLFSYYAVLNAGILAIAWFKTWRPLNVVGFAFTFVIGIAWGVLRYRADLFGSTEPFLILFFLFYLAIAILYALRQAPDLKGYVDGTLIFGGPVIAFGIQSGLLHDRRFELAFSALALSALYIALAWILHRRRHESLRLLIESFLALGVAFLTLAVPLALDGRWSAASWALEGAALVWIGCRQDRKLPRASGALLQVAAGLIYWWDLHTPPEALPILNSTCLGGLLIAAASVFASVTFRRHRTLLASYEAPASGLLFVFGLAWWLIAGVTEIDRQIMPQYELPVVLGFLAVTAALCSEVRQRLDLPIARVPALLLLPVMYIALAVAIRDVEHPAADGGFLAWPVAFIAFYRVCRREEGPGGAPLANLLHVASLWLFTGILCWEFAWAIDRGVAGSGSWPAIAWVVVPAIVLGALPRLGTAVAWPFRAHRAAYVAFGGAGLAVFMVLWSITTNVLLPGDAAPLPYVPILNPLDIAQAIALVVLLLYAQHVRAERFSLYSQLTDRAWLFFFASIVFIWANAILLRTIHHWTDVPYEIEALMRSTVVQTSLTIFWTLLALASMLYATRRAKRALWVTGAVLLCIVVLKLIFVDLSRVATVGRIVSFVGVGVLMLIIGYFSPMPPSAQEKQ